MRTISPWRAAAAALCALAPLAAALAAPPASAGNSARTVTFRATINYGKAAPEHLLVTARGRARARVVHRTEAGDEPIRLGAERRGLLVNGAKLNLERAGIRAHVELEALGLVALVGNGDVTLRRSFRLSYDQATHSTPPLEAARASELATAEHLDALAAVISDMGELYAGPDGTRLLFDLTGRRTRLSGDEPLTIIDTSKKGTRHERTIEVARLLGEGEGLLLRWPIGGWFKGSGELEVEWAPAPGETE